MRNRWRARLGGGADEPSATPAPGLVFPEIGGPVLAVAGLVGGAGATTVATVIARQAAHESPVPIMVAEFGGLTAGLGHHLRMIGSIGLADLVELLARGEKPRQGVFQEAVDVPNLRVIAARPSHDPVAVPDRDWLARVVNAIRHANGLVVVDCGTLAHQAQRDMLEIATHVLWVTHATQQAAGRALQVLRVVPPLEAEELVMVRSSIDGEDESVRRLATLAEERATRLILVPHLADLEQLRDDALLRAATPITTPIADLVALPLRYRADELDQPDDPRPGLAPGGPTSEGDPR